MSARESGETLIEVLMASALMALVVVAIIGGLATTVLSSRVHRQQADANTALVAVIEHLKSPTEVPRVPCADATTYLPDAEQALSDSHAEAISLGNLGWPGASVLYTIEHETMVEVSGTQTLQWIAPVPAPCVDDGTNTLTLQRITVTLTTADGGVTPALSFVKGDY